MTRPGESRVRVRIDAEHPVVPRYCACCLLSMHEEPAPEKQGLELPWCEDCRRHAQLRVVDRVARGARWGAWLLAAAGVLGFLLAQRGISRIVAGGAAVSFLFIAIGLSGLARMRFEERKESCAATGRPGTAARRPDGGWEVSCESVEYARLLAEANPGARVEEPGRG